MHLADMEVSGIASRLLGAEPRTIVPCGGGRNSRVYRVEMGASTYALKFFPPIESGERRDRLGTEFHALEFLFEGGAAVPRPYRRDATNGCALYEWIEGVHVLTPTASDVADVLHFLRTIHALSASPGSAFGAAAEATFNLDALVAQLERRIARLEEISVADPSLEHFLAAFRPAFDRSVAVARQAERGAPTELAAHARTLSPSDFSVHNALRRADGRLVFFDFEYFGWDDPVKLSSDFLWHPAMTLEASEREQFRLGALHIYGGDPFFEARLRARYPLFGLKWCLILLNEYLPERWRGRVFSGESHDWESAKRGQLDKAVRLLQCVCDEHPVEL